MNTEITEINGGWLLYDGECAFCRWWAARSYRVLQRRGCHLAGFQTAWARERLGAAARPPYTEMRLVTAAGRVAGGADALLALADAIGWLRPLAWLGRADWGRRLLRGGYAWVARHRHCVGGRCAVPTGGAGAAHHRCHAFYELP